MYVKLFADILQSSLWSESSDTRIVWVTMLALANQRGLVRATAPGIAHEARVPMDQTIEALKRFESPDPHSRTPDHEGRRIERVDGGYQILNYMKYRALYDEDARRDKDRERQARARERHALSRSVTVGHGQSRQAEAEAEAYNRKDIVKAEDVVAEWNRIAEANRLPKCVGLSAKRKAAIDVRLGEAFFEANWKQATGLIAKSAFLLGQNDRGWKANLDWFLRPDSVIRIMEGSYSGTAKPGKSDRRFDSADSQSGKFDGVGTVVGV